MKQIRSSLQMIRYNLKNLVGFELLFKVLSLLLFTPLFIHLFDFILNIRGYHYLTFENIGSFFFHPLTIFLLILLVLLIMVYTMFDITTVLMILDCSYHKKKISITDAIQISLGKCKTMFHFKNIGLAFLILFLIPFLHIGISTSITIPEYILMYILKDPILILLVGILLFFFLILLFRWLYVLPYYVLEEISFKEATKKSIILGHKNHLKDWLTLLCIQLVFVLLYFLFLALGIFLIYLVYQFLANILIKSALTTILSYFIAISFVIFLSLSTPISYAAISSLYYIRKEKRGEKGKSISITRNEKKKETNRLLKKIILGLIFLSFLIGTIFTYGIFKGKYNFNIEFKREITITAHRGASSQFPENTMAAFIGAKELKADFIELDVQQTKDKEIIVMHDKNLKRTTGFNQNVWELSYNEIKTLDAGGYFREDFVGEKIPILKDVIAWAKENNIKLNIELKPTGNETDFESSVIQMIKDADYMENAFVASQNYEVLERVKQIDTNVKTIYVASIFYGDIDAFPCADDFSLEVSNLNRGLVKKIHKEGKKIYAWTVNTEENMKKMIFLNIDNLITDDIELARTTITKSRKSNLIAEYIKWMERNFKRLF